MWEMDIISIQALKLPRFLRGFVLSALLIKLNYEKAYVYIRENHQWNDSRDYHLDVIEELEQRDYCWLRSFRFLFIKPQPDVAVHIKCFLIGGLWLKNIF
jgi:hypothetical protein